MKMIDRKWVLFGVVTGVITVFFALFSYYTPLAFDDLMFKYRYLDYTGGEEHFSWSALLDYAKELRANDNGRLSNIICGPLIVLLPHWLLAVTVGVGFALMYTLIVRIGAPGRKVSPYVLILVFAAGFVLLPFRNHIIVFDYVLNYLFPTLFVLWFVVLICRVYSVRLSKARFLGAILITIIAAMFHEGFSVSVCVALGVFALSRCFRLPLQWWILAVLFGLVTIWVVTAPGVMMRADRELAGRTLRETIVFVITVLPAVSLMLGFFALSFFNRTFRARTRHIFATPALSILAIASVAASVLTLMVNSDPRSGWPAEVMAMPVLLSFVNFRRFFASRRVRVGAWALLAIVCVFCGNVIRWQRIYYVQSKEIEQLLDESESGTIFYDIIDPRSTRLGTLFMVTRDQWVLSFHYYCLSEDVNRPRKEYAVVPVALRDFSPDVARPISGTGHLFEYNGVLAGYDGKYEREATGWYGEDSSYTFTTDDGSVYPNHNCLRLRFRTPDGKVYMYVYPVVPIEGRIVKADFEGKTER